MKRCAAGQGWDKIQQLADTERVNIKPFRPLLYGKRQACDKINLTISNKHKEIVDNIMKSMSPQDTATLKELSVQGANGITNHVDEFMAQNKHGFEQEIANNWGSITANNSEQALEVWTTGTWAAVKTLLPSFISYPLEAVGTLLYRYTAAMIGSIYHVLNNLYHHAQDYYFLSAVIVVVRGFVCVNSGLMVGKKLDLLKFAIDGAGELFKGMSWEQIVESNVFGVIVDGLITKLLIDNFDRIYTAAWTMVVETVTLKFFFRNIPIVGRIHEKISTFLRDASGLAIKTILKTATLVRLGYRVYRMFLGPCTPAYIALLFPNLERVMELLYAKMWERGEAVKKEIKRFFNPFSDENLRRAADEAAANREARTAYVQRPDVQEDLDNVLRQLEIEQAQQALESPASDQPDTFDPSSTVYDPAPGRALFDPSPDRGSVDPGGGYQKPTKDFFSSRYFQDSVRSSLQGLTNQGTPLTIEPVPPTIASSVIRLRQKNATAYNALHGNDAERNYWELGPAQKVAVQQYDNRQRMKRLMEEYRRDIGIPANVSLTSSIISAFDARNVDPKIRATWKNFTLTRVDLPGGGSGGAIFATNAQLGSRVPIATIVTSTGNLGGLTLRVHSVDSTHGSRPSTLPMPRAPEPTQPVWSPAPHSSANGWSPARPATTRPIAQQTTDPTAGYIPVAGSQPSNIHMTRPPPAPAQPAASDGMSPARPVARPVAVHQTPPPDPTAGYIPVAGSRPSNIHMTRPPPAPAQPVSPARPVARPVAVHQTPPPDPTAGHNPVATRQPSNMRMKHPPAPKPVTGIPVPTPDPLLGNVASNSPSNVDMGTFSQAPPVGASADVPPMATASPGTELDIYPTAGATRAYPIIQHGGSWRAFYERLARAGVYDRKMHPQYEPDSPTTAIAKYVGLIPDTAESVVDARGLQYVFLANVKDGDIDRVIKALGNSLVGISDTPDADGHYALIVYDQSLPGKNETTDYYYGLPSLDGDAEIVGNPVLQDEYKEQLETERKLKDVFLKEMERQFMVGSTQQKLNTYYDYADAREIANPDYKFIVDWMDGAVKHLGARGELGRKENWPYLEYAQSQPGYMAALPVTVTPDDSMGDQFPSEHDVGPDVGLPDNERKSNMEQNNQDRRKLIERQKKALADTYAGRFYNFMSNLVATPTEAEQKRFDDLRRNNPQFGSSGGMPAMPFRKQ